MYCLINFSDENAENLGLTWLKSLIYIYLNNETFFVSNDFFYKIIADLNFSHNIKDKLVNKLYKNIENEQKLKLETLFTVKFYFIENL